MEPIGSHFAESQRVRSITPSRRVRRADGSVLHGTRAVADAHVPERAAVDEVVPQSRFEELNRLVNIVLAGGALLVLLPLMVLIALLIRMTSKGPILYAQSRVGLNRRWRPALALHERRLEDLGGQVFTIYKFRTMRVDAEQGTGVGQGARSPRHLAGPVHAHPAPR